MQRFTNDHQDFMSDGLVQIKWLARKLVLHRNSKFMTYLLRHRVEYRTDISGTPIGVAQVPNGFACFVNCGAQLTARIAQQILFGMGFTFIEAGVSFEQCGNTRATLDQCVMHFARQPVSLFEHGLKAGMCLAHAELVASPNDGREQENATTDEPGCPIKMRLLKNLYG